MSSSLSAKAEAGAGLKAAPTEAAAIQPPRTVVG